MLTKRRANGLKTTAKYKIKTDQKQGGKKNITLAKIREDFPEITGKLHENNPVLDGVDLHDLYKFIQENAEVRQLNMYGIVEKYKQNKA